MKNQVAQLCTVKPVLSHWIVSSPDFGGDIFQQLKSVLPIHYKATCRLWPHSNTISSGLTKQVSLLVDCVSTVSREVCRNCVNGVIVIQTDIASIVNGWVMCRCTLGGIVIPVLLKNRENIPLPFGTLVELSGSSAYFNARPWRINFASGQVDFQLTCPDGQFEIKMNAIWASWFSLEKV